MQANFWNQCKVFVQHIVKLLWKTDKQMYKLFITKQYCQPIFSEILQDRVGSKN